jgi:hypothetical protein
MHCAKEPLLFLDTMNTQVHETTKAMPYELVFGQPPRSIIIPEPRLKGTFDEEQLDEKDGDIIDDEVVKEEDECNIDESITEDIKQETYNEEDQNELLKCEMSMQQQVMQQLTDTHYHNPLFVQCREISLYWRLTLRRSLLQMQRIPVNQLGLKKHIQSHYCLDPCLLKRNIWRYVRRQMLHT